MAGEANLNQRIFDIPQAGIVGEKQKPFRLSDDVSLVLSLLTGQATENRKLLRCDSLGRLLIADPWSDMASVETAQLTPQNSVKDTSTISASHQAILFTTSTLIVKLGIVRRSGGSEEYLYAPPNCNVWIPARVYSVSAQPVPFATGGTSYVGVTAFN